MDTATLVSLNLAFQVILAGALAYAAVLARKRQLDKHCRVVRFTLIGQVLSIAVVMLPQLIGLVNVLPISTPNGLLMWGHHAVGLVVVGLWVYINLAVTGKITVKGRLLGVMRVALVAWLTSLVVGVYVYSLLWPWPWA
jgi:hypothetical protein